MKVSAVSCKTLSFKNSTTTTSKKDDVNFDYAYMYQQEKKTINFFSWHKKEFIAGFLALIAAIYSLSRFSSRNTTPKNIVELFDKGIGLNKVDGETSIVHQLKEKILYPIMSINEGYTSLLRKRDLKTGVIIGGERAKEVYQAFVEHAKALGIECIDIRSEGRNRAKEVNKAINSAFKFHVENKNKCVIVNIGDIGAFSKLRPSKTNPESNIEKRLQDMPKGIVWVGWTEKTKNLPYFYNNTPTLYAIMKK